MSYDSVGGEPVNHCARPTISGDGSLVAWDMPPWSVPSGLSHIWLKDLTTGLITNVTPVVNSNSIKPRLSADGGWITFSSNGPLIPGMAGGYVVATDLPNVSKYELVSVTAAGLPTNGKHSDISGDGRHVVFQSQSILDPAIPDTNGTFDVAVRDRGTGAIPPRTTLLSVSLTGTTGNAPVNAQSISAAISDDGRHVVFSSDAVDLVPGDVNNMTDVFAVDRDPDGNGVFDEGNQVLTLVSVNSQGQQANNGCHAPDISEHGRWVVFQSAATNLAPEQGGTHKIFLTDRDPDGNGILDEGNAVTIRVDKTLHGQGSNGSAVLPRMTADAGRVAWHGSTQNLLPWTGNNEVYVWDRATGVTRLASIGDAGQWGNASSGYNPADPGGFGIAGDGTRVAFVSSATNLVAAPPDTNGVDDIYYRDLCIGSGCGIGTNYCTAATNSTGLPAAIHAVGSNEVVANQLLLVADQLPPGNVGIFFIGTASTFVPNLAGGQGNLCAAGSTYRFLPVSSISASGTASYSPELLNPPPGVTYPLGSTRYFQFWFRDFNPLPTSNLTDGIAVTFQ